MNEEIAGELLHGSKRRKITERVLLSEGPFRVSETARYLGLSKAFVSKQFGVMERAGILERKGNTYLPKKSPVADAFRTLMTVARLAEVPFGEFGTIGAGLYGSRADGRNTQESDADVWAFFEIKPAEGDMARLSAEISAAIGAEADLLVLWPSKLDEIRDNGRLICALRRSRTLFGRDFVELETMY